MVDKKACGGRDARSFVNHIEIDTTLDEFYRALAHRKRREILAHLPRADTPLPLNDLAADLATPPSGAAPSVSDRADLGAELHHTHLPLLDDCELLTYESDQHLIRTTPATESVQPFLGEAARSQ